MTSAEHPPVALTCGDPSGIGPEIALKAWRVLGAKIPFFWIGDPRHLPDCEPHIVINAPEDATDALPNGMPVLPTEFASKAEPGSPARENAASVVKVIERAVALTQSGRASAVCTAPISKKVLLDDAGFAFPGHTEFLASLAGVKTSVMMLASEELRVVPVTIHIPLSDVPRTLTQELLETTLRTTEHAMRSDFGIKAPRIAVAGLNPHAGENGMLGVEDEATIRPICDKLRGEGWKLSGPLPADTMFHARARDKFDVAVAMYHDQALIPIKTLAFDEGVNTTLGLPFVRTSPDHGTAFDIAGKDIANPSSLVEALKLADKMALARRVSP